MGYFVTNMIMGNKVKGTIAYLGGLMSLPEPFVWSWSQMIEFNKDYLLPAGQVVNYFRSTVSYHVYARNNIVDNMMGDWLLMLDTDISFDPDIAVRMLNCMEKHKIDVLSAFYNFKASPHSPLLFTFDKKAEWFLPIGDWGEKAEIIELGSAGAGCLMVKKSVFDRIRDELNEGPFDIINPFSEDHSFFKRLWKLKIKAYFNPHIEVHHLAYQPLGLKDYKKDKVSLGKRQIVQGFI